MIYFVHPRFLLLFLLLPALAALFVWADRKRAVAVQRFIPSGRPAGNVDRSRRRRKRYCILVAALCVILAAAQPVWTLSSTASTTNSGDVVFLLDVSRSMLSADVAPTRLANAKSIIGGLTRNFRGERMALVTFAGVAAVLCPLSIDKEYFDRTLDLASPDSVARGGTRIAEAIQMTLDAVFDDVVRSRKKLVILTDGGDQGSFPQLTATIAAKRGIGLIVIGVGDDREGALVPTSPSDSTPIVYQGQLVRTKLETGTLSGIALAGKGVYLDASRNPLDTSQIYDRYISAATGLRFGETEQSAAHWLLLFAISLLIAETLLTDRKSRAAALALMLAVTLSAQPPAELVSTGNIAFRESHWSVAIDLYETAALTPPVPAQIHFNLGATYYRMKRYAAAADSFQLAASNAKGTPLEEASKLALANCAYRLAMAAPLVESLHLLREVLPQYQALSSLPDARFNAEVVKQQLTEMQKRLSEQTPATPSARRKAFGAGAIAQQGGLPTGPQRQTVDKDW